jgi:hypothetical protein
MSYDDFPDPFETRVKHLLQTLLAGAILAAFVWAIKLITEL